MKKWSKLVLATMLSVGTLLVSGCIENIEPEGIADLRGAKAELLRAQTALQAAQAAKVEAEAALVLAQAKVQEAIAKQEEARAKYQEAVALKAQYEAEAQNITNEEARSNLEKLIAENEAAIEKAKLDAEKYALELQDDLIAAEKAAIDAQKLLDQAMKDMAAAKATLTSDQRLALDDLEGKVTDARDDVKKKTETVHNKAMALARATAQIDDKDKSTIYKQKEKDIEVKKAEYEATQELEQQARELLEKAQNDLVDWEAEKEALEEEVALLTKDSLDLLHTYTKDLAALATSVADLKSKYEAYQKTTGYKFDYTRTDANKNKPYEWGTGKFGLSKTEIVSAADYIKVPDVEVLNDILGDFKITSQSYEYEKEDAVLNLFDKELVKYSTELEYEIPYKEMTLANRKEKLAEDEADEDYVARKSEHAAIVAAIKSGDYLPYMAAYVYTVDKSYAEDYSFAAEVKKYNDALKDFESAFKAYDDAIKASTPDEVAKAEIEQQEEAEKNAIEREKVFRYQEIVIKYQKAKATYDVAKNAYDKATHDLGVDVKAVETAAGKTEAEMNTWLTTTYPGDLTATDEEKAEKAKYEKALKDIDDLRKAFDDGDPETLTDPKSVYDEAYKAWTEAEAKYKATTGTEYATADAEYNEKIAQHTFKYKDIWTAFNAKYPTLDAGYKSHLFGIITDAKDKLDNASTGMIAKLNGDISGKWMKSLDPTDDYTDVEYDHSVKFTNIPKYFVSEDGKTLVALDVKTLADEEFMSTRVKTLADALTKITLTFEYDTDPSSSGSLVIDVKYFEPSGYPEILPDEKTFIAYVEDMITKHEIDNNKKILVEKIKNSAADISNASLYVERYVINYCEQTYNPAYAAAIPAHVEAVKAAKAEFEAFVKTKTEELDAVKKEVEEAYTAYIAKAQEIYDEFEVTIAANKVLRAELKKLKDIISAYCNDIEAGKKTHKDLVDALTTNLNTAIGNTITAEKAVLEAEWLLEKAKTENLNAVEIAEIEYNNAVEELQYAMDKLERLVSELEAMLAALYDGEVPDAGGDEGGETPAA